MTKSVVTLVFTFVLLQLGNASPTINNLPATSIELPNPDAHVNINSLEDITEESKKPILLLVPVGSSEENDDPQDEEEGEEGEEEQEEEEESDEINAIPHRSHKTKRCKSFSSLRKVRRVHVATDPRKYSSASTESSIDESLEMPYSGQSLFRVASEADTKRILRSLLKSRPLEEEGTDAMAETVSGPHNQDSIRLVSKDLDKRDKDKPKKYVCYCFEEGCGAGKRPRKKYSRPYATKKTVGPNFRSKSGHSPNYQSQDGPPGYPGSENIVGAPNNLRCPPGAVLMEKPERVARPLTKYQQKQQHLQHRPMKKYSQITLPGQSDGYLLGQPTKIHIPLAGNRKWNRRVYKVDRKSPFAQKLQSVIEQKATHDRLPCPEPESSFNEAPDVEDNNNNEAQHAQHNYNNEDQDVEHNYNNEAQDVEHNYNNEQSNYDQYYQIPVSPNLVYPGSYVVYPHYPQYPHYDSRYNAPGHQISLEPASQAFVGQQKPSHNQYMPTPLGRNFVDLDQCVKLFGPSFCITTTTTISPVHGHANNCDNEHEEPDIHAQWQGQTHYTTESSEEATYRADEATTDYHRLGATQHDEQSLQQSEEYSEDHSEQQDEDRVGSEQEHHDVTTSSSYSSQPENQKFQTSDETSEAATSSYEAIGSKHEEKSSDYDNYENFVDEESPTRHDDPNFDYSIPLEDSYESDDYPGSSEEIGRTQVLQKKPQESVTEAPAIASTMVSQNLLGAHRMSSPKYVEYTEKPSREGVRSSSSEDASKDAPENTENGPSHEGSNEASTESPHLLVAKVFNPHDALTSNLEKGSQEFARVYPFGEGEDRVASTPLKMHGNNEDEVSSKHDVHCAPVAEQGAADYEPQIPMTSSHQQNVGITQSTPVDGYSKPEFDLSATIEGDTHYATMDDTGCSTQPLLGANEPQEHAYGSAEEIEKNEEIGTEDLPTNQHYTSERSLGDAAVDKYYTGKQTELNIATTFAKTTNSHRQFVGKPQSTPADNFSKPDYAASATVGSKNEYATSYATMADSSYAMTPLLGGSEPGEQIFSSNAYPQFVGSHQSTLVDSSAQPGQLGATFETRKTSSSQPLNEFVDAETSYATMENSGYDTTPVLEAKAPEDNMFTSHSPHSTRIEAEKDRPASLRKKWSKVGKTTSSHQQLVGITQSTPLDDFSQSAVASTATMSGDSHYTTSYATMEDTGHTTTSLLGAKDPEEEILGSTIYPTIHGAEEAKTAYSWPQEDVEEPEDNIEEKSWNSYYSPQSEMENTNIDQHYATEKNSHSQFVGSHQMTNDERYFSTEINSHPQFGTEVPEDISNSYNLGHGKNWYYTTGNQQGSTGQRQFVASHHSTPAEIVATTKKSDLLRMASSDSSKTYWPATTERSERHFSSAQSERPFATVNHGTTTGEENLSLEQSGEDDIYSIEDIRNQYVTDEPIVEDPVVTKKAYTVSGFGDNRRYNYRAPSGPSNQLSAPSQYQKIGKPEKTLGSSLKQWRPVPMTTVDSGIKEESNAYFTSKAYDDNISAVTGPDSYFEGEGLKSWNDFTSMSSDDFFIGDVNRAEEVRTDTDRMISEDDERQTTDVSPRCTTNYQLLGRKQPLEKGTKEVENNNKLPSAEKVTEEYSSAVGSTEDVVGNPLHEENTIDSTPASPDVEHSEKVGSPISNEEMTKPDDIVENIPNSDHSMNSYERVGDVLEDKSTPEDESHNNEPIVGKPDLPSEDDEHPDDESSQPLGNPLGSDRTADEIAPSSDINYEDSNTASNLLQAFTTRSSYYDDNTNLGAPQEIASKPNCILEQTAPTVGSTEKISNEDQLCPEDRNILKSAVEQVVKGFVFDRPVGSCPESSDVVGAPSHGSLPGLPELPILKNLLSVPVVRNMAIDTVKGLISGLGGVPQESSLGRFTDRLINTVFNGVVDNVLPGPVTTTSSGMVDEHRFENGQWTVVPVNVVPKSDQVAMKPDDEALNTIENIVGSPGIGPGGARLPAVQNIIVHTVENVLKSAKHAVDHSVIWDILNDVIARAEEARRAKYGILPTLRTITKAPGINRPDIWKPDTNKPSEGFKNLPAIPVTERVFKNGQWIDQQTLLGDKRKDYASASMSSYDKSAIVGNQLGCTTDAADYALIGESEEDAEFAKNTNGIVGTTENAPMIFKPVDDLEEDHENAPIKYYSPNDRILSYIKNHQNPEAIVGSPEKSQTTPHSSCFGGSTENYWPSSEQLSNELSSITDDSVEFAQATHDNSDVSSTGSEEPNLGSIQKSTIAKSQEEEEKMNAEEVASGLRESSQESKEHENYSGFPSNVHHSDEHDECTSQNFVGKGNPMTSMESESNSGGESESTESSEFSRTLHHLDVDDAGNNDYTMEDYVANENPSATEELGRNMEDVGNTKPTPGYIDDDQVGNTQSAESESRSEEQMEKSTEDEYIGASNQNKSSEDVEASIKIAENYKSSTIAHLIKEVFGTQDKWNTYQSVTEPIHGEDVVEMANGDESGTEDLDNQFVEAAKHHDLTEESEENVGNAQSSESQSTEDDLSEDDGQSEELNSEKDINLANALTPDNSVENPEQVEAPNKITENDESSTIDYLIDKVFGTQDESNNDQSITEPIHEEDQVGMTKVDESISNNSDPYPEDEASVEATKHSKSFSDVSSEILQAVSEVNAGDDVSAPVFSEPVQESPTEELGAELTKVSKAYDSVQEAATSSDGLMGAARSRVGKPRRPSPPRERLGGPRDSVVKEARISSGGSSRCVTPQYDPTYFGKISLNGVNPGGDSISDLTDTDLYYVGDGVKLPLTIQRMPDGSYALSISEKICENFVRRKCPCCVPREGDIVEERKQSNEAENEDYGAEKEGSDVVEEDSNNDSFQPTESAEFQGKSKKRYARSTLGCDVVVTSATPVENFVKKYNLTLSLDDDASPPVIRKSSKKAEETKSVRRKVRLSSSRDTKIPNLFGNNNEIQRDDSEEAQQVREDSSDPISKVSNSIRRLEYNYDTNTNDFIQSLLHIKDVPEEKRAEIVLNALDGLVNSASEQNPSSMDRYSLGDSAQDGQNHSGGSDEYDLDEMANVMSRYGYQKDNPILERIRFIKAQQNSHGQYKYQKNIDPIARGKMNMLKTVLHWLRQLFLEKNSSNQS